MLPMKLERILEVYDLLYVTSSYQEVNYDAILFELTGISIAENYCKENGYL